MEFFGFWRICKKDGKKFKVQPWLAAISF